MARHVSYPADHKPGMAVPKGGSSCASCKYLRPNLECANKYFQKWHGGNKIPAKSADSYCSDYYEPTEAAMKRGKKSLGDLMQERRNAQ